jgi:hypothetical protein
MQNVTPPTSTLQGVLKEIRELTSPLFSKGT